MTQAYRHIRNASTARAVAAARVDRRAAMLNTFILSVLLTVLATAGWMQLT